MVIALPAVKFLPSYPQVAESVSASRAGNRVVSIMEWADPYWRVDMKTVPLKAGDRMLVEAFRDACRGGLVTVHYSPTHMCLPKAHWGDKSAAVLANGTLSAKDGFGVTVAATTGLALSAGDLISMTTDDYNWMARVVTGGTAAAGALALTLNMAPPSYIEIGATVRFKDIVMNARMLPGSFSMPDDIFPSASFTLIEVPK